MKPVWIIDDDRSIRRSLEKFLGDLGYAVSTAEDGLAGLAAIEQGGVDLVLLDLGLPGLDGLEVLARLQGDEVKGLAVAGDDVIAAANEFAESPEPPRRSASRAASPRLAA